MVEMKGPKPGAYAVISAQSVDVDGYTLSDTGHKVYGFATQLEADEIIKGALDVLEDYFMQLGAEKAGKPGKPV